MVRRTLLVIALAILVASAGCTGTGGDGVPDESTGATTAPGDGSSGGDDGGSDGAADDGDSGDDLDVADPESALREAGSFTTTMRINGSDYTGNTGEVTHTYSVDFENERYYGYIEGGADVPGAALMERFSADGVTYVKMGQGDEAIYFAESGDDWFSLSEATLDDSYYDYADEQDDALVKTGSETFDGVSVTRYEATDVEQWAYFQPYVAEDGRITDFEYVILVDDDGVVRSMTWYLAGVDESGDEPRPFSQRVEMRLTDVGTTTVEDPDWLDEARAKAITAS
jgi:hypothetical protein